MTRQLSMRPSRPGSGPGRLPGLAAAAAAAAAAAVLMLAGCGRTPAGGARTAADGGPAAAASGTTLPLATSLAGPGGISWAVVQMGGPSTRHDNFWQLFVRPAGTATWQLATPAGVADNGGLVIADTGARSLVTGFRPSQDLKFSPLSATADGGAHWSQGTLVSPGLADVPDGLAGGPGGRLIALTDSGSALLGTRRGARWTALSSQRSLAGTAAGRACGLTGLTAAAFTAAGTPLLAGACAQAGVAGIFAPRGGSWSAAGPALPDAAGGTQVLGLGTAGARTTALLAVGQGATAGVIAAWSGDGGYHWRQSAEVRTGALGVRSASVWAGGAAGLVLAGGRGAAIAGPGLRWQSLPKLPAGAETLARGPSGGLDALVAAGSRLSVWRLGGGGWRPRQTIRVPIPYGSSG